MRDLPGLVRAATERRISRRRSMEQALAVVPPSSAAGSLLVACGDEPGPASGSTALTAPRRLHLSTWSEHLAPAVREKLEAETGIEVVETFVVDDEALLARLQAGAVGSMGRLSPNVAAAKTVGSELVRRAAPSDSELEQAEMIQHVGDFARQYTDAWARVKSA